MKQIKIGNFYKAKHPQYGLCEGSEGDQEVYPFERDEKVKVLNISKTEDGKEYVICQSEYGTKHPFTITVPSDQFPAGFGEIDEE